MALAALITAKQLENRLTPSVFARVFNDYGTGEADSEAVSQIIDDATSKVRGELSGVIDIEALQATNPVFATELRRLTLDAAHAMCAQRSPSTVPVDGFALLEQVERELKNLREGQTSLVTNVSAPGSGSGSGSTTSSGDGAELVPTVDECRPLPGLGNFFG